MDMGVNKSQKTTFGGVLLGVIMLLVAFNVAGTTVDVSAFGTFDDLSAEESSKTNTTYNNQSHVILADGETDGTWTSNKYTGINNATKVSVYAEGINANNSLSVQVEAYDDTGTSLGTKSVSVDSGRTDIDVTTIASSDTIDQIDLTGTFSRDATTDQTPELTSYEGFEEGETPYLKYAVVGIAVAVMLFALRW